VKDHLSKHTALGRDALLFPASAEESPYFAGTLDKIISQARRDRADYGFAQLRLIVAFLRWHDLRHTRAVLPAQTGATLAELMGRLGHTAPAMRYQYTAADRDAEIARRLSALVAQPEGDAGTGQATRVAQVLPS